MTVPALNTTKVATFAYYQQTGCTYVQLVDVLSILHSYVQHAEYVDGTIKIYDTGSESGSPNNYVLVNVRIRADGWIMAWFPRTLMTGTADSGSGVTVTDAGMQIQRNGESSPNGVVVDELAGYTFKPTSGPLSGKEYTIQSNDETTITLHGKYGNNLTTNVGTLGAATYEILNSRGNLVWWGHHSSTSGNPTAQSTRLGRALYEVWEALKTNQQGGSGAALSYSDVGYWDYEYPAAVHLYVFGYSVTVNGSNSDHYYYCTIPVGVVLYAGVLNYGVHLTGTYSVSANGYLDGVTEYGYGGGGATNGHINIDLTAVLSANYGIQKTMRSYTHSMGSPNYVNNNQAFVLLTSG